VVHQGVQHLVHVLGVVTAAALGRREPFPRRAHQTRVEGGGPLGDVLHPRVLAVCRDEVGAAALHECPFQAVQCGVDGGGVVAAAGEFEGHGAHVLGVHLLGAALVGAAGTGEELLDLPAVVATAPPHGREQVLHRLLLCCRSGPVRASGRLYCWPCSGPYSWAASWPQAPSMSLPRVSRTVVGTPAARKRATNSASTSFSLAVQIEPGVGLSGMGLTCTQPRPRCSSFSASRSARQGWSFMSLMRA